MTSPARRHRVHRGMTHRGRCTPSRGPEARDAIDARDRGRCTRSPDARDAIECIECRSMQGAERPTGRPEPTEPGLDAALGPHPYRAANESGWQRMHSCICADA